MKINTKVAEYKSYYKKEYQERKSDKKLKALN